jgi:C4-type Zn-finger protein
MMEACPICGSKMQLTHFADFSDLTSTEIGRCDECGFKGKKQLSRLQ